MSDSTRLAASILPPNLAQRIPHTDLPERLLTAEELADRLSLSLRTVWRLDSAGKLPRPIRLGGSVRWRRNEIERWLQAGCPDRKRWEELGN
jgi:excisionase family DNA binding protein